ncbi:MAG: SigmaK-factor processing regulatory BofA [Ruminococcaceae bacterium]|nr:SigmaK-factor processing regulatory BofA [Oscillospiraceae bacterium]
MNFTLIVGYLLGILIAYISAKILLKPFKSIFKILLNSIIAFFLIILINKFSPYTAIYIGANPLTALTVGILGLPGLCLILILQILF